MHLRTENRYGLLILQLLVIVCSLLIFSFTFPKTASAAITSAAQLSDTCTSKPFNVANCTPDELAFLNNQLATFNDSPSNQGQAAQFINQGQSAAINVPQYTGSPTTANSCSSWSDWIGFTCFGRLISVLIGTALIAVTAWLLAVAGMLFNLLVDHTVVNFGQFMYSDSVKFVVENTWTVFRDVANILIIGIFVFIAISIILGLAEFGQKKLVAKVLIIAVLINFSLLFTKVIVDASNFTALQFFKATQVAGGESAATGVTFATYSQSGISGQFINLMGLTGIGDTVKSLSGAAFGTEKNDFTTANGWMALLHGLASATLLLAAALVLLYGCFMLVARAVLIIFLLITSSLAFASYLIPKLSDGEFGWKTWWQSLLGNAIFAPILMLFLWATMSVGKGLKEALGNKGTLGDLMSNPTSTLDLNALFMYVLVIGLLFTSIRVASSFASRIGGFSMAASLTMAPFAWANQFGIAPLMQRWRGGNAAAHSMELDEEISKQKIRASLAPLNSRERRSEQKHLASLLKEKSHAEELSKSSFNMMNSGLSKAITKGLGVKGFASGADHKPGSFAESAKGRADEAAAKAAGLTVTKEEAMKAFSEEHKGRQKELETQRDQNKEFLEQQREIAKQISQSGGADQKHEANKKTVYDSTKNIVELDRKLNNNEITQQQHATQLAAEAQKISQARDEIKKYQQHLEVINEPLKAAEDKLKKSEQDLKDFDKALGNKANELVESSVKNAQDISAQLAQGTLGKMTNALRGVVGMEAKDDIFASMARGVTKKKVKASKAKERRAADDALILDADGPKEGSA